MVTWPKLERSGSWIQAQGCGQTTIDLVYEVRKATGSAQVRAELDQIVSFAIAIGFRNGVTTWASRTIETWTEETRRISEAAECELLEMAERYCDDE